MTHDSPTPGHPTTPPLGARRRLRALTASFLVLAVLAFAMGITALIYIAAQNRANGERLIDCTTPHHACYDRGQTQTGEAVGEIGRVILAANFCATLVHQPLTRAKYLAFTSCVGKYVELGKIAASSTRAALELAAVTRFVAH